MALNTPRVSVIIPTHNRCAVLRQTLDSLARQTFPLAEVEVIVVADGCSDGTAEMLAGYPAPFSLQTIAQPSQGPAAARNAGAALAAAELLIFVDDDIETAPSFIEAHVSAHRERPGGVVIGYLPPVLAHQTGLFRYALQSWWERMFDVMDRPGHRFAYTDLLSGNFSLAAELFRRVGGFDTTFRCHEDYELGVRLHKEGAPFAFAAEAKGYHHEVTDLNRALHRKYQEGQADVQLGDRYPELRPTFLMARLYRHSLLTSRMLLVFAFWWPGAGDALVRLLQSSLRFWEWAQLRGMWRRIVDGLLGYWYWRGAARELGTLRALRDFLKAKPTGAPQNGAEIDLDLRDGLDRAEQRLDRERPAGARLRYGQRPLGRISPQPGGERLRGAHLRPLLANKLAGPLLQALTIEGAIGIPISPEQLQAACKLRSKGNWPYEVTCD